VCWTVLSCWQLAGLDFGMFWAPGQVGTPVVVWLGLILVHGLAPSLWLGAYPADPLSMFHEMTFLFVVYVICWYLLSLRCFGPVLLYHDGSRSPVPDSACDPSADLQKIWYVESQINFPNLQVVSSTWSWSWKDPTDPTSLDSQLPWQMPARCCQATCSSPRYLSIFAADWIKIILPAWSQTVQESTRPSMFLFRVSSVCMPVIQRLKASVESKATVFCQKILSQASLSFEEGTHHQLDWILLKLTGCLCKEHGTRVASAKKSWTAMKHFGYWPCLRIAGQSDLSVSVCTGGHAAMVLLPVQIKIQKVFWSQIDNERPLRKSFIDSLTFFVSVCNIVHQLPGPHPQMDWDAASRPLAPESVSWTTVMSSQDNHWTHLDPLDPLDPLQQLHSNQSPRDREPSGRSSGWCRKLPAEKNEEVAEIKIHKKMR